MAEEKLICGCGGEISIYDIGIENNKSYFGNCSNHHCPLNDAPKRYSSNDKAVAAFKRATRYDQQGIKTNKKDEAVELLKPYLEHKKGCPKYLGLSSSACNCGLDALLSAKPCGMCGGSEKQEVTIQECQQVISYFGHIYEGKTKDGYAVCEFCGAVENTDESAKTCPRLLPIPACQPKQEGEFVKKYHAYGVNIYVYDSVKAAQQANPYRQMTEQEAKELCDKFDIIDRLEAENQELKKDKSHLEDIESDLNFGKNTIGFMQTGIDNWKAEADALRQRAEKMGEAIRNLIAKYHRPNQHDHDYFHSDCTLCRIEKENYEKIIQTTGLGSDLFAEVMKEKK